MRLDPYLGLHIQINSKWIKDLDKRAKAIKLLEENDLLYDIGFDNNFFNINPKA